MPGVTAVTEPGAGTKSLSMFLIDAHDAGELLGVLVIGVITGIFVGTQLDQVRVQNNLGARDFTLVKHSFEVALGRIMPDLVIASAVTLVVVFASH